MAITNLTNTKWVIRNDLSVSILNAIGGTPVYEGAKSLWNIDFTTNGENYSSIGVSSSNGNNWDIFSYDDNTGAWFHSWTNQAYRIIEITGGTDVTNATLIAWLQANGTLTAPTPTKTFDLSTLQLSAGTHEIKVKARSQGYRDSEFSNSVSYEAGQWSCVVAGLGSENPSSVTFTHTGTMPTFEEVTVNSNVFIKIPKMYRKVLATSDNQITSFEIATYKKDNDFVPYTCFIKEDGTTEMDYVLIGKYYSNSTSVMNSINTSGENQKIGNARTHAQALGTGYQLYDWQMHKLWQDLIICKKQTIDTNAGTAWTIDELGIYWGTNGFLIDGIACNDRNVAFSYLPSRYIDYPTSSSDGYNEASYTLATSDSNITKLGYDSNHPFVNIPSSASGSSYTTYYCDTYTSGSGTSRRFFGSVGFANASAGAFRLGCDAWSSTRFARLCYRPI